MREEVYDISGMHCAACSASVEKVTRRLPGVERSDVNLVAERMTIVYDETQVTPEQIIAKVEKAGFGAKLHQEKQEAAPVQTGEDPEELELRRKERELIVSAIFSCALLYVSMGQMLPFGLPALPLPDLFSMHTHPMNFAVLQLMLAIPVLYCGRNFFINGFQALFHGNPNMDSLVAIGSACSFVYSVVMMFLITDDVHGHVHNLYYESSAVVLTLVSLGKFMESRNMKKTKSAITALMRLTPDTALLADSGKEVPTSAVKAGDVLLVKPGARVPLDGVVTKGESSVNEAMLTGESLPVEKAEGSEVIGGSVNENGVLYVKVTRVGEDTTLSQIIQMVGDAAATKAPIAKIADKVSGVFVPAVISIAVAAALLWATVGGMGVRFCLSIGIACGIAGIISVCITMTGLGGKLITYVVKLSGGNLFIALFLTMICCIILGMGVPTTANYIIMASTCAPILINGMSMHILAANMFVFYFGIVADITPPVALAAYAGAAIAKAPPMKTALNATRLAIAAFIIPYIFAYNNAMIFVGDVTFFGVASIVISATLGMASIASGFMGYLIHDLKWYSRVALIAGGLLMVIPGTVTDLAGLAILIVILLIQKAENKKEKKAAV